MTRALSSDSPMTRASGNKMDLLTAYGFVSVCLMLLFYWLEDKAPVFVFLFAISCLMASVYGFLQGAWPFGFVESVWSIIAFQRWMRRVAREHAEK